MKVIQVSRNFTQLTPELCRTEPDEMVMLLDVDRCIACGSCQIACQVEHDSNSPLPIVPDYPGHEAAPASIQTRFIALPLSCRHCESPCEYFDDYNFWTSCPRGKATGVPGTRCDSCIDRALAGFMPACATRCTMKCIIVGCAADILFTLGEKRLREMGDLELKA